MALVAYVLSPFVYSVVLGEEASSCPYEVLVTAILFLNVLLETSTLLRIPVLMIRTPMPRHIIKPSLLFVGWEGIILVEDGTIARNNCKSEGSSDRERKV